MTTTTVPAVATRGGGLLSSLNTKHHKIALGVFAVIVLGHWAEHLAQAFQIWALDRPRPEARGLLGAQWPWLVSSEWLHFGFAVVMLVAFAAFARGFTGRARLFWIAGLVIQLWHFVEHGILFAQAQTDTFWFGAKAPSSVAQQFWPMSRPELHLFYNAIVTIPMVVAMYFHLRPPPAERRHVAVCTCVTLQPA